MIVRIHLPFFQPWLLAGLNISDEKEQGLTLRYELIPSLFRSFSLSTRFSTALGLILSVVNHWLMSKSQKNKNDDIFIVSAKCMSHQFVFKEKNPFNVVKIKLLNTTSYNFQISKCTFNSHKTYLVLKNLPPSHKWILEGVCLLEHPNSVCTDYHSWPRNKLSELETL